MKTIPPTTIPMKVPKSLGVITLLSMIREGRDNVVMDIIRAKMVPTGTDAKYKASAIGKVPKISAYSGNIEGRIKPSPRHARRGLLPFYLVFTVIP